MPIVNDNFNRANETPLASPWNNNVVVGRTYNLVSNTARTSDFTLDAVAAYTGITWPDDQVCYGDMTCNSTAGGTGPGLALRCAVNNTSHCYNLWVDHAATNNVRIRRFYGVGGGDVALFTQAWTDGDRWGFRVTGPGSAARLQVYHLGNLVQDVTDSPAVERLDSGSPGISFSSVVTSCSVDNWTGGDTLDLAWSYV